MPNRVVFWGKRLENLLVVADAHVTVYGLHMAVRFYYLCVNACGHYGILCAHNLRSK